MQREMRRQDAKKQAKAAEAVEQVRAAEAAESESAAAAKVRTDICGVSRTRPACRRRDEGSACL